MIEAKVETYLKEQITNLGGLPLKFTSPGVRGVPDQLLLWKGQVYFIELKRPGSKPRKTQVVMHKKFKEHGQHVYVIDTIEGVDNFIRNVLDEQPVKLPQKAKNTEISDTVTFKI